MLISMLGNALPGEMTSFASVTSRATTVKNPNGKRRPTSNSNVVDHRAGSGQY